MLYILYSGLHGCLYNSGVLFVGVLVIRALLFGVCIRAPDFWKLPHTTRIRTASAYKRHAGFISSTVAEGPDF